MKWEMVTTDFIILMTRAFYTTTEDGYQALDWSYHTSTLSMNFLDTGASTRQLSSGSLAASLISFLMTFDDLVRLEIIMWANLEGKSTGEFSDAML